MLQHVQDAKSHTHTRDKREREWEWKEKWKAVRTFFRLFVIVCLLSRNSFYFFFLLLVVGGAFDVLFFLSELVRWISIESASIRGAFSIMDHVGWTSKARNGHLILPLHIFRVKAFATCSQRYRWHSTFTCWRPKLRRFSHSLSLSPLFFSLSLSRFLGLFLSADWLLITAMEIKTYVALHIFVTRTNPQN